MARARNIKPGFFRNADLVELSFEARLLFIGLWTIADRAGRLEDRPKQIKMELFPADNMDCDALLGQLAAIGMIERYSHGGSRVIQVVSFTKHQNPHRDEKASTLPDRDGNIAAAKEAPCKHSARTVQDECKQDSGTVAIGLNPSSLIPDSLILNPESGNLKPEEEAKPARASRKPSADAAPTLTIADLTSEGVDKDHAAAWFSVRKASQPKKGLTQVAWDGFKSEARKAGITVAQAVHICAIKEWRGFDSTWRWQGVIDTGHNAPRPATHGEETPEQKAARREEGRRLAFGNRPTGDVIDA